MLHKEHPDLIAIKHNLGYFKFFDNLIIFFIGELYVAMKNDQKASEYLLDALETIKALEEKQKETQQKE